MAPDCLRLPAELAVQIDSRLGPGWSVAPLGVTGQTYAVWVGGRTAAVIKRLRPNRRPEDVRRALEIIRACGVACPVLLASAPASAGWLALFEHIDGHSPDPSSSEWAEMWSAALSFLPRLTWIRERVASWDLESEWLENVAPAAAEYEAASDLLRRLRDHAPDGIPCLAHGDFAPQNFVLGAQGLALIDWEEVGYARPGFDAGWLLSLNRVGAGPRWQQEMLLGTLINMGIAASNLNWFEGMGLLRMHARAHSWKDRPLERALALETIRSAIWAYAA